MNTTGKLKRITSISKAVMELDRDFFPNPWSEIQWKELNFDHHYLWVWENAGEVLAFALFSVVPGDDTAHLYKILIAPDHRGSGMSLEFWSSLSDELKLARISNVYLEVEATNDRAAHFYKKLGFVCLRRVKSFYSNGSDGLILQLTL